MLFNNSRPEYFSYSIVQIVVSLLYVPSGLLKIVEMQERRARNAHILTFRTVLTN